MARDYETKGLPKGSNRSRPPLGSGIAEKGAEDAEKLRGKSRRAINEATGRSSSKKKSSKKKKSAKNGNDKPSRREILKQVFDNFFPAFK